jgi:anti-sigma regulatory factor (Ser/Thr protein kinase)
MPSIPRYLAVIRAAVGCMASQDGFPADITDRLVLAADEALANVIKHGYGTRPDGEILVILRPIAARNSQGLDIVILDRGKSTDPAAIRGRDLADIRPGGLGVHIMRSIMDKVQYRRRSGGGMLLRMVKYNTAEATEPLSPDPLSTAGKTPGRRLETQDRSIPSRARIEQDNGT